MFSAEWFNLSRVLFWLILTPVAYHLGWLHALPFTALLSIWALVETAWAAYEASRNKKLLKQVRQIIREELERSDRG